MVIHMFRIRPWKIDAIFRQEAVKMYAEKTQVLLLLVCGLLCACTTSNAAEPSRNEASVFCDTLHVVFDKAKLPATEWNAFAAQVKGVGDWQRLPALYRWESDLFGLDWYGLSPNDDMFKAWLDTLGIEMPLSSFGRTLSLKNRRTLAKSANDILPVTGGDYYVPAAAKERLRMVAKLFQQIGEWKFAFFSLKESFVDDYSFEPYSAGRKNTSAFPAEMADKYMRLAYLAWRAGRYALAEKNYRIAKMIDEDAECNEGMLSDTEFMTPDLQSGVVPLDVEKNGTHTRVRAVSRKVALDSIRTLYMSQRLQQRVMWLAEQDLVKPLSAEEKKDWATMEAKYCSPAPIPCGILGSETDGPVGFGKALEEEWTAGD